MRGTGDDDLAEDLRAFDPLASARGYLDVLVSRAVRCPSPAEYMPLLAAATGAHLIDAVVPVDTEARDSGYEHRIRLLFLAHGELGASLWARVHDGIVDLPAGEPTLAAWSASRAYELGSGQVRRFRSQTRPAWRWWEANRRTRRPRGA